MTIGGLAASGQQWNLEKDKTKARICIFCMVASAERYDPRRPITRLTEMVS